MSFKPSNMANPFARQNTGTAAPRNLAQDLMVRIDSWDVGNKKLFGLIENGPAAGDMATFSISKRSIDSGLASEQKRRANPQAEDRRVPWAGWRIDSDMAAHLRPGAMIVVERAQEIGVATPRANGTKQHEFESWRIANVQQDSPEKTFAAIITISTYEGRVFQMQRWAEQAFRADDSGSISEVARQLDRIADQMANKEYPPTLGVQFSVVLPNPDLRESHTCIDLSPPFDYIARQRDEQGNEIAPGRPLDSETFLQLIDDYKTQYVDVKFPQHEFPGVYIEVSTYLNYRGSRLSNYLAVPDREFDPIHVMSTTTSKLAQDDTQFVHEKNCAVRGVVQITADQPDEATRSFIPRNFVYRLHVNGRRDHVRALVMGSDGRRVSMAPELRLVMKPTTPRDGAPATAGQGYTQPGNNTGYGQSTPSAPPANNGWGARPASAPAGNTWGAPQQTPAPDAGWASDAFDDMDEGNPFGDLGDARARLSSAKDNFGA